MADAVSTLALRVDTQSAITGLQNFGNTTKSVGAQADQLGAQLNMMKGKLLGLATTYLSFRGAKMYGGKLLEDAATGQEALGKFEAVLGRFTTEANDMVKDLVANFNQNTADAQQALSTMVDQFRKSGNSMRGALDMSYDMQKLAGDLEAFTNAEGGTAQVAEALASGIMGQYMPLKKFGIVLNEEMVKAQMAKEALEGLTFTSEQAAKQHARYSLIMKQSASAQGQVAREADNFNNVRRKLKASLADLSGQMGEALVPAATLAARALTSITQWAQNTTPTTKAVTIGIGALAAGVVALGPPVYMAITALKGLAAMQTLAAKATDGDAAAKARDTTATSANTAAEATNTTATNAVIAAKNLEATSRMRNATAIAAENSALASQGTANLVSGATSGVGGARPVPGKAGGAGNALANAAMYAPIPGGKSAATGAAKTAGRAVLGTTTKEVVVSSAAKRTLGGAAARGVLGRSAAGMVGKAAVGAAGAGALGQAAGGASKLLRVFAPLNSKFVALGGLLGKGVGLLGKFAGKLVGFLPFGSKILGFFGKSAIIGKVVGLLGRFAGIFVPFVGWVSTAITALEVFKHLPEWFEKFANEMWPQVKDFLGKIPEMLMTAAKAAGAGIKKIGNWIGNLVVDSVKGIGSMFKRAINSIPGIGVFFRKLWGDETEAQKAYKAQKLAEETNKRRAEILDAEKKQREAELKFLGDVQRAQKAKLRADAEYAASKNDDQTNLQLAQQEQSKTETQMSQKQEALAEKQAQLDEISVQQRELAANREFKAKIKESQITDIDERAKKNRDEQDELKSYVALRTANPLAFKAGVASGVIDEEKVANADARLAELKKEEEQINADRENVMKLYNESESSYAEQMKALTNKREDLVREAGDLADEQTKLAESYNEQRQRTDELKKAMKEQQKAEEEEAEQRRKIGEDRAKDLASQAREEKLATAKTRQERIAALDDNIKAAQQGVDDAKKAQEEEQQYQDKINQNNAALNSESVAQNLRDLTLMSQGNYQVDLSDIKDSLPKIDYSDSLKNMLGKELAYELESSGKLTEDALSKLSEDAKQAYESEQKRVEKEKQAQAEYLTNVEKERRSNALQEIQTNLLKSGYEVNVEEMPTFDFSDTFKAMIGEQLTRELETTGELSDESLNTLPKDLRENIRARYNLEKDRITSDRANFEEQQSTNLLSSINQQREDKREENVDLKKKRDDATDRANNLASSQGELLSAQQAREEEDKSARESEREELNSERDRREARMKLGRQREETFNNEMFQRQITTIDANVDKDDPWGAYNAAGQKYDLVANKGLADWNASQAYMSNIDTELNGEKGLDKRISMMQRRLDSGEFDGEGKEAEKAMFEQQLQDMRNRSLGVNGQIEELRLKEREGTATEEDIALRQQLESRRDTLQSDYDSEYDKALTDRWNTEKELFSLQQTMAEEEDKQLREYVNQEGEALKERLEEEAAAQEEMAQKRLAEQSEVQKEQRKAISAMKAIASGTSEAFQIESRIYDRGVEENLPVEKQIKKDTKAIEKHVKQMTQQMYMLLSQGANQEFTLDM